MEIHAMGAANTVTGSQFVLTTERARVVVDCGMFQGGPHEVVRNRVPLAYDPATVDAILLTHAHLDHCGLIPHVVNQGFAGPIYATAATAELARIVLEDSGKLQEEFTKRHNHWALRHPDKAMAEGEREQADLERQLEEARKADALASGSPAASGVDELVLHDEQGVGTRLGFPPYGHPSHGPALHGEFARPNLVVEEPLYTQEDATAALERFRNVEYERPVVVAPGITATFHDAGHILGSSIIELRVDAQSNVPARTLVFSGDLGRKNAPILRDPTPIRDADYVFVESTYGGRLHEPQEEAMRELEQAMLDVADEQGVLLVPAFAIGRTQDMIWALNHLLDERRVPHMRLFLDSPMASKASAVYRRHVENYDEETLEELHEGDEPLEYPDEQETTRAADSERVARAKRPYAVIASNGMLTGGRVLSHVRRLVGDTRAMIFFVGYQGEGTLGAQLQAGAKTVRVDGTEYQVRCAIRSVGGFSAHADERELLDWLTHFVDGRQPGSAGFPRRVFLVHGDPEAQEAMEPKVQKLGLATAVPHWHERISLD